MAYDAGEAFIQIVPSFRGVVAQIEAEAAKWGLTAGQRFAGSFNDAVARGTRGAQLGPGDADAAKQGDARAAKFADAFKTRITAALRNLPDITVDANTSDADAKIAELRQRLTELRDAKIGVDIDEATAIAAIDDIKAQLAQLSAESSSIEVRANTGAAMVELDRLRAQLDEIARDTPDVDVKANTGEADAKLAGTKAAADELGRSSPTVTPNVDAGPALAAIGVIRTALLGLSAGAVVAPLVGGLAAMLGPLAAVGAGFAGIAAVGIPALSAVTKAQQAQTAATQATGQSAAQSAAQQSAAINAVITAEESLANARRQAANDAVASEQKVQQAEQNVTTAQKAAADAQIALTNAREAATRSLQDSQFSVQDAQLALQADQLAVTAAQQNLNQVNANATSTDLQKQQAALQLAQAQQALVEQQVTLQRSTEDNTAAQKAGVDGSKQVVAAQQQVTSTATGVVTATAAVAAARKAAADQAAQDAQRISDAQRSLAQAQLSQAAAAQSSAGASAKAAAALAALTPAERTLYDALQNLKGQFHDFNQAVDPSVVPVFSGAMKVLGDLMKPLEPLVIAVARAFTAVQTSLDNAVRSPAFKQFIGTLTSLAGPSVKSIAAILGNLGLVIGHLITAFAPLSGVVLGGLQSLTGGFANATKSPALTSFVKTLVDLAPTLISAFHSVGGLIGQLFKTLAPLAQPVLAVIGSLATALTGIVKDVGPALTALFRALAPALTAIVSSLAPAITSFIQALAPALASLTPALTTLGAAISQGIAALGPVLQPIADLISAIVTAAAPLIPVFAQLIGDLLPPLAQLFTALVTALQPVLDQLITALEPILPVITQAFTQLITALTPLLPVLAQLLIDLIPLIKPLGDLIVAILRLATDLLPIFIPLIKAISPILDILVRVLSDVVTGLTNVIHWITDAITWFKNIGDVASTVAHAIGTAWDALWKGLKAGWDDISKFFSGVWKDFAGFAGKAWDTIAGGIKTAFGAITGFVKGIWHDVENVFVGAVNWVVNHILNPIIDLLNAVLGVFGIKIDTVADISTSVQSANAVGGVLPGYSPGTDNIALPVHMFSGGEGILVPEATRALGGEAGINAINSHYSNRVGQKFSQGGVTDGSGSLPRTQYEQTLLDAQAARDGTVQPDLRVDGGGIGGVISDVGGATAAVISAIRSGIASATIAALNVAEAPIKAIIGLAPGNLTSKIANGFFSEINRDVDTFIRGNVTPTSPTTSVPTVGYEHQLFIETALYAGGHSTDPFNVSDVNTIVSHESGWNPNAINLSDSNAAAGHPSQGLMQTIPSTFEAYRIGSLPDVITDPLANLAAGIRYAFGRYGSLGNVPGVKAVANGQPYVGYDNGGYLPPGLSSVYNASGRPEPVFNAGQWDSIKAAIANRLSDSHLEQIARNTAHLETYAPATAAGLSAIDGLHTVMVGASS